jgi:hypothetical protein
MTKLSAAAGFKAKGHYALIASRGGWSAGYGTVEKIVDALTREGYDRTTLLVGDSTSPDRVAAQALKERGHATLDVERAVKAALTYESGASGARLIQIAAAILDSARESNEATRESSRKQGPVDDADPVPGEDRQYVDMSSRERISPKGRSPGVRPGTRKHSRKA